MKKIVKHSNTMCTATCQPYPILSQTQVSGGGRSTHAVGVSNHVPTPGGQYPPLAPAKPNPTPVDRMTD